MNLPVQSTSIAAMASSQNATYHKWPCPLWGKKFEDIVETAVDPAGNTYHFIHGSWFDLLSPMMTATEESAMLIRDPYEALYNCVTRRSSLGGPRDSYSGIAVIGQPGIGRWHCVSLEDCLMVMCRQVAVSAVCAPSPPVRKKAYRVSIRAEHHLDFRGRRGPKACCILGGIWIQTSARHLGIVRFEYTPQSTLCIYDALRYFHNPSDVSPTRPLRPLD